MLSSASKWRLSARDVILSVSEESLYFWQYKPSPRYPLRFPS